MRKTTSKFVCLLGLGLFLTSASAMADGYGPAGCGLGSMIFEPDSGFTQVFAATTNGTSGNQTFGITSGTSNCASGGVVKARVDPARPGDLSPFREMPRTSQAGTGHDGFSSLRGGGRRPLPLPLQGERWGGGWRHRGGKSLRLTRDGSSGFRA